MQTPPKTVAEWVVDSQECAVEMDVRGEREKQVQVKRPTGVSAHMQVKVVYTLKVLFLFFLLILKPSYWIFYTSFFPESSTIILLKETQFSNK